MIAILTLLFLTIMQGLAGFGVLTLLKIWLRPILVFPLSLLIGLAIYSFIPFLLELLFIPITAIAIAVSFLLITWLLNWRLESGLEQLKRGLARKAQPVRIYEIPFFIAAAALLFISIWRCYYLPPTPRDLTSGAEVIAEYAVKEKTMINSLFSVNLESTNNPFKPASITSLQIIYKYAGFPFGQVWLSIIVVAFTVFLWGLLRTTIHPLLAGFMMVLFLVIPEMYAYSFMALYDYPNAVYFALAAWALFRFFHSKKRSDLWLSAIMMSFSTYFRSETLILAVLLSTSISLFALRKKTGLPRMAVSLLIFLAPAVLTYLLSVTVYLRFYLPVAYNVEGLMRSNLLNPLPYFKRLGEMSDEIIFSVNGVNYYSYFIFFFIGILLIDSIWREPWDTTSLNWLFAVLVIYAGLPFVAFLFPLFDLDHSTKRGLFKIFPLMLLYMGHSRFLRFVSRSIRKWEKSYP